MAAEVQVVTTTDNTQTVGAFTEVEQKAKSSGEAIEGANNATKGFAKQLSALKKEQDGLDLDERIKRVKDIFDNAAPSVDKLTAEVKEYQSLALAAGRESPVGREFLEKAAQKISLLIYKTKQSVCRTTTEICKVQFKELASVFLLSQV